MAVDKAKILLGIGTVLLAGANFAYDYKSDQKTKKEQMDAVTQAAYEASTKQAKEWYAAKGNPNARRKPR